MTITEVTVNTSGLYEWGRGFMNKEQETGWDRFWQKYDGIFWHAHFDRDGSVFLSSIFGGGMIHPMDFTIAFRRGNTGLLSTFEELDEAMRKLAKELKFTYRMYVRVLVCEDPSNDMRLFSTEKGVEESLPGRVGVPQEQDGQPSDPLPDIGAGPYRAEIVRGSDGRLLTEVGSRYKTVEAAVAAVVRRAKVLKHRVNPMQRHWVTSKKEHMVDYGSYTFYGRITSNRKEK